MDVDSDGSGNDDLRCVDERLAKQAVLNLILNALQAMESAGEEEVAGEAQLIVRTRLDGEFARVDVELKAELRARGMRDAVTVTNIAPGGVVCAGCPFLEQGDAVEIVIDDTELSVSYRFSAIVAWSQYDDNDDCGSHTRRWPPG